MKKAREKLVFMNACTVASTTGRRGGVNLKQDFRFISVESGRNSTDHTGTIVPVRPWHFLQDSIPCCSQPKNKLSRTFT
jgi:hypothetical protein